VDSGFPVDSGRSTPNRFGRFTAKVAYRGRVMELYCFIVTNQESGDTVKESRPVNLIRSSPEDQRSGSDRQKSGSEGDHHHRLAKRPPPPL